MNVKQAKLMTKEFKQDGVIKTPALSDDWTYSFETYYNNDDKVKIHSEKLDVLIYISMGIQHFFDNFIYTKKLTMDGNKLIGTFAFNKYDIFLETEFLEALELVESLELNDPIPNNELIEFGVYLDNNGEHFVYLGNIPFSTLIIRQEYSGNNIILNTQNSKDRKRYIVNYDNKRISYSSVIQKTGKRKFFELIEILNSEEKDLFLIKLLDSLSSSIFMEGRFNHSRIIKSTVPVHSEGLVLYNQKYGYFKDEYNISSHSYDSLFFEIDFEKFYSDLGSNTLLDFEEYKIHETITIDKIETQNMSRLYFYFSFR